MMGRMWRVLATALLGCGALVALFTFMTVLTIIGIFHYDFALDAFVTFMAFMVCWGVGRLIQDQLVLRRQKQAEEA